MNYTYEHPQIDTYEHPQIDTSEEKHRRLLLAVLLSMGYKWHGQSDWSVDKIQEEYPFEEYPVIIVHLEEKTMGGNRKTSSVEYHYPLDVYDILGVLSGIRPPCIIVEDVGEYSATITEKRIEIGCQTVSWEKFDEIAEARKTLLSNKH